MKILVAQNAGFCFGVKRAIDIAYKELEMNKKNKIFMLREIIHNSHEVKKLIEKGVKCVEDVESIKSNESVIISTHGITLHEEKILKQKHVKIIDTTCPYVKKIHNIVKMLNLENYQVIIIGDKEHYEVKGIRGHSGNNTIIITTENDLKNIKFNTKIGIVAQTTFNLENFNLLLNDIIKLALKQKVSEIKIFNTICDATFKRQEETKDIAKKVDIMIIIGGKNSANTKRLYEICKEILDETYFVEDEKELKKVWFKNKNTVGISAGASTPDELIKRVISKIESFGEK